jgi:hypothetical protein
MERLTERGELGYAYYPRCFEKCNGSGYSSKCDKCDYSEAICNKLAEFEDTGLTPEQIALREDDIKLVSRENKEFREEILRMRAECERTYNQMMDTEKQGLLINITKDFSTEEVKDIFHTLMQSCYGIPIPKETTDNAIDDLMR